MKHFRLALLGALLLLGLLTTIALAHAKFVKSEPAPDSTLTSAPSNVKIWFSEELDTKQSNIKVFNAAGAQVDNADSKVNLNERTLITVTLKSALANGVYMVKYHAVSDDDKGETDGDFKFTLNMQATPSAPTPAATVSATLAPTALPINTPAPTPSAATSVYDPSLLFMIASAIVLCAGALAVFRKK